MCQNPTHTLITHATHLPSFRFHPTPPLCVIRVTLSMHSTRTPHTHTSAPHKYPHTHDTHVTHATQPIRPVMSCPSLRRVYTHSAKDTHSAQRRGSFTNYVTCGEACFDQNLPHSPPPRPRNPHHTHFRPKLPQTTVLHTLTHKFRPKLTLPPTPFVALDLCQILARHAFLAAVQLFFSVLRARIALCFPIRRTRHARKFPSISPISHA